MNEARTPERDRRDGRAADIADREFPFTHRDFRAITSVLNDEAGIAMPVAKAPLVYARLVKRLRALGMRSFREYCALVIEPGAPERAQMIAALTTNVTRFFREPHHFAHMREQVLPALLHRARRGGRVRLWSAGCSTGEEPYSIALTILAMAPDAARFDIKILATDIDPEVLAIARAGTYSLAATAPIEHALRERFLFPDRRTETEKNLVVSQDVRALVAFRELNLIADWPMKGRFDLIFCRNVVIYFEDDTREAVWRKMARILTPGGHLYIGHSERITNPRTAFVIAGNTIYRLPESAGTARAQMNEEEA